MQNMLAALRGPIESLDTIRQRPQRLPTPTGAPSLGSKRHVVVVGGGLAGCAAACVLAERGARVTLVEKEAFLGGRVGAWTDSYDDGSGSFEMERGFHAFFRQYYNLRNLLRRIDPPLAHLTPLHDYPLHGPDGRVESFTGLPHTTPANLIALIKRTPTLGLRDLMRIDKRQATQMLTYDADKTYPAYDHKTAAEFLDSLNFPPAARQMLFEVFAHSFFNPEEEMSAAEMIRMFHFYFTGNPEGLVFDVLDKPFSTGLWDPMRRYLESHGVAIRMQTAVRSVERVAAGYRVMIDGARGPEPLADAADAADAVDAVILAVTVPALQAIVDASPQLDDPPWRAQVAGLELTLPFVVWRLWLHEPPRPGRQPFIGTAGLGLLDNISLFQLIEDESAEWARRTGGSVVELHAYAVPEHLSEAEIRADLWHRLVDLYPEYSGAKVLQERYLYRRDCPGFAPGKYESRPGVETPWPTLCLAGDFVKLPTPAALMEGATTSGFLAANQLLGQWETEGEVVWSVPQRGILSWLPGR